MINDSLSKLLKYIEKHQYKGYDPYDLKGLPWYMSLAEDNSIESKGFLSEINKLNFTYPKQLRAIYKVKAKTNNKALALFALSYINMYESSLDKDYLKKAKKLSDKLLKRVNKQYSGMCWGYPFDWKSGKYTFTKNTPSIVVTVTVANVFIKLYKLTHKKKYIVICKSIVDFILKDLHRTKENNTICFSYTPHDTYQIHNANLMAAEFLSEIGILLKNKKLLNLSKKATYFTINQQNDNGSIYYYGNNSSQIAPSHLDIYHSGFEIRSLINIYKCTNDTKIKNAYLKYLNFFQDQYFIDNSIPKLGAKLKKYSADIVDIHGLAEAILTLNKTKDFDKRSEELLENVLSWGIKNMQTEEGWFIFRWIRENNTINKVEFPFMRWGQAWMIFALTEVYKRKSSNGL